MKITSQRSKKMIQKPISNMEVTGSWKTCWQAKITKKLAHLDTRGSNFWSRKVYERGSQVKQMHADSLLIYPNFSSKLIARDSISSKTHWSNSIQWRWIKSKISNNSWSRNWYTVLIHFRVERFCRSLSVGQNTRSDTKDEWIKKDLLQI